MIVGRNFDWWQSGGNLSFVPARQLYGTMGYAVCVLDQFGEDRPFEGVNQFGLFVGIAGFPDDLSPLPTRKSKPLEMDELGIVRFVLERAESTKEALEIFNSLPVAYKRVRQNIRTHYLLADSSGNVATWGEKENERRRRLSVDRGFVLTNFPLSAPIVNCWRYNEAVQRMGGVRGPRSAMKLLQRVKQRLTVWSAVFDLNRLKMTLCIGPDYDFQYNFDIGSSIASGESHLSFPWMKILMNPAENKGSKEHPYKTAEQMAAKNGIRPS